MRDPSQSAQWGLRMGLLAALLAALPALFGCPKSDDPAYYIKRLEKDNEEVRRRAVEELHRMHKKAMPYITGREPGDKEKTREAAIDSPDPDVRMGVADFLAKVRRIDSLEAAGELIDDEDKAVRLKAIEAVAKLAQVWKNKSVELLARAFQGEDPECVQLAGEGLRDMEYEGATEALRQFFDAGEGIQAMYAARFLYEIEPDPNTARPLLLGLISDDQAVREAAQANVMELKDRLVAELVELVDTEQELGVARAAEFLKELRGVLIEELDVILDSARAAEILMALGAIADEDSVAKLKEDLHDTKLEKTWRVSAARAMAAAALSTRATEADKADIRAELTHVLDDEEEDDRIRIGAAIALCELRQEHAVRYLLDELDRFQDAIQQEEISEARLKDLTQLRIWAQEALTTAGDFVVDFLMNRMRRQDSGPIIRWAAAKTFGELGVERAVPDLGRFLTGKRPEATVGPDGRLRGMEGAPDWRDLADDEVAQNQAKLEEFKQPDYVRWTAATALGRIGGPQATALLKEAEEAELGFLSRLGKNRELKDYHKRENVISGLIGSHERVVFYIRRALEDLGEQA